MRTRRPFFGRPRRGITMATVLFAIVIVSVMTAASVQTASLTLRSGLAFRQSQLALYSAEAGLRYTTANWPSGVSTLNPGDSVDGGWQTLPNHATYRAVITRVDGGSGATNMKTYIMVVQGRGVGSDLTGGQRTVVRVVGNAPIWKWGIFTSGGIALKGNAYTDSYNSTRGTYAQTVSDSGSVATNGSVSFSGGNASVKGACTAAGSVNPTSSCVLTSTQNTPPLPTMAMLPCPSSYTPASEVSGGSYSATTGALSGAVVLSGATQYYFSSISMSGHGQLTVIGGSLVNAGSFVVGQSYTIQTVGTTNFPAIGAAADTVGVTFTATGAGSGTGQASTAPAPHVDIYVNGAVDLTGNGVFNPGMQAGQLSINSCGSSTSTFKIAGNGVGMFTIYAPNSPLSISGNGDLYGAFIGSTFSNSGNGHLHFDTALQNTGGTTLYVLSGSWTELTVY